MRKLFASAALAASLIVPALAQAADEAKPEAKPNTGALSLSGGVDYVTQYYFRGVKSSPSGFIVQPYGQINVAAYTGESFSITPYVGTWNDIQDSKNGLNADGTGVPSGQWYESDVFGGITWGLPANFKLDTIYTLYTSPANEFKSVGEIGAKLAYDDTALMKDKLPFTLNPYGAYYFQTFNDTPGASEAQYAELGLTPTLPLGDTKLTATFPIAVGFSPDGYYQGSSGGNETVGFWSVGAFLTYPLPLPAKYGAWSITGGVTFIDELAASAKAANGGSADAWAGRVGLAFNY